MRIDKKPPDLPNPVLQRLEADDELTDPLIDAVEVTRCCNHSPTLHPSWVGSPGERKCWVTGGASRERSAPPAVGCGIRARSAQLTAVDGAVVLDDELNILGFGATISMGEAIPSATAENPRASGTRPPPDREKAWQPAAICRRICAQHTGLALALVASQNGAFSLMMREARRRSCPRPVRVGCRTVRKRGHRRGAYQRSAIGGRRRSSGG
jgi:hypothetical protein